MRMQIRSATAIGFMSLIGLMLAASDTRAVEVRSGWSAGVATAEITPDGPVWLAGYAARKEPSNGVLAPIFAKALALRDAEGETVVLVALDLVGVKRPLFNRVASLVSEAYGLPKEALTLVSSHTHCAPLPSDTDGRARAYGIDDEAMEPNREWTKRLEGSIVEIVGKALESLRPASAGFCVGSCEFAMNRREPTATGFKIGYNPDGPVDHSVPVLDVTGEDGEPIAVVFGYACHCTTLGGDMLQVCGDYAGFAQEGIEADRPGAVSLFLTGCGADSNPAPRGTVELARQHGRSLADAVGAVLDSELRPLSGSIGTALVEPKLQFAGPTDRESYEARLDDGGPRAAHAKRMIEDLDAGKPIVSEHPYPIHAFALGDLTMVTLGGEVVVDYAIRMQEELAEADRPLWVVGYADDVFGYVPSLRVLREGGYEGGDAFYYSTFPTPFAEDVEHRVMDGVREAVAKARGR
ncbi:neutral/alkaline non-lysosomal ceramidase N-terminal domain-containing protein [Tautonia marina]|uniref:neutral/alkaline non-lysosomal ceramidase N-terminal domain-containing protein n=1 Tax=Tautonia marina TaxID=2653855 RepID=UPI00137609ED|nr:neutral/alkaline non-lysosomal ceramidase N-terminal domain-containing protein [Tautonia marina]